MASRIGFSLLLVAVWCAAPASAVRPLSQQEVLTLLAEGFAESLVVAKVKDAGVDFELTVPLMVELKRAGASDAILQALLESRQAPRPDPPAAPAAGVTDDMALIPAGTFIMGAPTGEIDYLPARQVDLDAFLIDRHEVTNAEYERFDPHHLRERASDCDSCPVTGVSWEEAAGYARWAGKRLPTEAEWEKAARGPQGYLYGYGEEYQRQLAQVEATTASPVGSYPPNGYGLVDLLGNVWEWCADRYGSDFYRAGVDRNPRGPESGLGRVVRGGSFRTGPEIHLAVRTWSQPDYRYKSIGFRCARDAPGRAEAGGRQ